MHIPILKHPQIQRAKQTLKLTASRLVDNHINLAVTGLSGSGKTAFITSLVNQLTEANEQAYLPFFSVLSEQRLIGVRRDVQPNLTFNRFAYEQAMSDLTESPAKWPASTTGVSQIRLKIKYRNVKGLSQYLVDDSTLTLDITDYPGEWLLDLPLLDMNFEQWIVHCDGELTDTRRAKLALEFLQALENVDFSAKADELVLEKVAGLYRQYLQQCQFEGYQLIQPSRFILPGELANAPVLHFFPIPQVLIENHRLNLSNPPSGSNLAVIISRFEQYKEAVVKPFYKHHFRHFDRQIILVDCLSALNHGHSSFQDLQKALDWLMRSFQYGPSNIINRLFEPKIDKLVFAASKADHITPDQQVNLIKLLDNMLRHARKKIQFDGVVSESTAISAIRASKSGFSKVNGEDIPTLRGVNSNGELITLYPGEVPTACPSLDFWQQQRFEFPKFMPPELVNSYALPHIRMDQVLDFLLADKLR
ncbi:YcjX family protein [Paraglaciecola aquimarina]|uniref:YcjX family protein n=1 Tax=Paraglaciecola aquimarina TaxID=1235557 RepID=A0ABU3T014_9ALTE|nr:YcjX family protein [Paraglaciecola aquimarina]MDU0355604.1 YcjX family protein [Paraglaciecola aquimarina]